MRYSLYLIACLIAESVAIPVAFIAAAWPASFAWFLTPDNPIDGDVGHQQRTAGWTPYWRRVAWLLRNRAYGFKWGPLGCAAAPFEAIGNMAIKNRDNGVAGSLCLHQVGPPFWYRKTIVPLGFGYCLQLAFGWQLDAPICGRCLFMFSPRISAFRPASQP